MAKHEAGHRPHDDEVSDVMNVGMQREDAISGTHDAASTGGAPGRSSMRPTLLAALGIALFVFAMFASYSGAFGSPSPHHLRVAVVADAEVAGGLQRQAGLEVTVMSSVGDATQSVLGRHADTALVVPANGEVQIIIASGGSRSVATVGRTIGESLAVQLNRAATVRDVAPLSPQDPNGTIEFYAVIFLTIGASLGATVFGRLRGRIRTVSAAFGRTGVLILYSALLAFIVTIWSDSVLGALTGHAPALFLVLFAYCLAVGGAISGIAALGGTVASAVVTMFLVIFGNGAAGGAIGRALLPSFFSDLTPIVPQGAGVSLVRSVLYFHGTGTAGPMVTLAVWGGAGLVAVAGAVALEVRSGARARHAAWLTRSTQQEGSADLVRMDAAV